MELTVYSIEIQNRHRHLLQYLRVATELTVYGIIRKIKYSKINKNHGICRGFFVS